MKVHVNSYDYDHHSTDSAKNETELGKLGKS